MMPADCQPVLASWFRAPPALAQVVALCDGSRRTARLCFRDDEPRRADSALPEQLRPFVDDAYDVGEGPHRILGYRQDDQ